MATPRYSVRCLRKTSLTHNVLEIALEKPAGFLFQPGQFVLFDVPLMENASDIQTRAYSIASLPKEPELLFVIKIKPDGRAGQWITNGLDVGGEVTFQGPLGLFTLDPKDTRELLFIATGVGMAPFRSQILTMLNKGTQRKIDLIVGVFSEEDLFWIEEFEKLAQEHPHFSLHTTLSNPSPNWKGHTGFVQKIIPNVVEDIPAKSIYLCGNPLMTTDTKKLCLEEWNVPQAQVHMEGYI